MQMMSSFCRNFISNIFLNLKIFNHHQHFAESFASQILIIRPPWDKKHETPKVFPTESELFNTDTSVRIKETCSIVEKRQQF